ncbi:Prefoldin subunit 4 OS=Saccharomyces cerevisiae (strain ATCC 204508 / S288c) GN=GIM3 PE=1 SV=1 [Rhizoctonia solani AG-1 IB]|uniref:Prefoldin subunit 4 n=1 Tax=Thanatephorus cucumeris (strain AG1-IB / isolate 7/3/14) TaxID=1108050 RepID=A0A0B7FXL1_THACB|nr:Prefoldin subunit 4 OS=Saccharomyces cerevisiae (strain ATCC 204508 / S288c) GN=GIM3 PE=1 SV=1 [Rhizoctonia solani AG-1 IB]
MRMLNQDDESEENTEVTWEDQQKINTFSKLNTRCSDLEEKIAKQKSEKEALDDLAMELELADEDEPVKYKIGEALFHISLERAQALIQKDQESVETEINGLQGKIDQCQQEMKNLKVALYAKFGKQINLD